MPTVVPFETLTELFLNLSQKYNGTDKKPFYYKPSPDQPYEPILWDQVTDDVYSIATYLMERGIEKGDRVAILSENRYEWVAVDMAIQLVGG
ncbi:MAG: long-chain fatty acid--CoA ligase, partial [Candidatus Korarchaeota archaeon]|nr:long-chain fatty acid--CoA ligase [Candidatus Korarchaeota archaeon]NIU82591.1 AMP-binding protein [Candidatus Thorarchaeota archaeon]